MLHVCRMHHQEGRQAEDEIPPACRAKHQAFDHRAQAAECKSRLDAALSAQRQLALQLGRLQARGGGARSRACAAFPAAEAQQQSGHEGMAATAGATTPPAPGQAEPTGVGAQVEAAAARRFAVQQEQLVVAQEQRCQLEVQLKQQREVAQEQARELCMLRARLAAAASHAARPQQAASAAQGSRQGGSDSLCARCGALADSEQQERDGPARLRLEHLQSRAALERCTASNTRLLRELEDARRQMQALQQELSRWEQQVDEAQRQSRQLGLQALHRQTQAMHGVEPHAGHAGLPCEAWAGRGTAIPSNVTGQHTHRCGADPPHLPAPSTATVLQLKQQLAETNYRASRLQIELDAALAKLAALQEHSGRRTQGDAHFGLKPPPQQQAQKVTPPTQQEQQVVQQLRMPSPLPLRNLQPQQALHGWQPALQRDGSMCSSTCTSMRGTAACAVTAGRQARTTAGEACMSTETAGGAGHVRGRMRGWPWATSCCLIVREAARQVCGHAVSSARRSCYGGAAPACRQAGREQPRPAACWSWRSGRIPGLHDCRPSWVCHGHDTGGGRCGGTSAMEAWMGEQGHSVTWHGGASRAAQYAAFSRQRSEESNSLAMFCCRPYTPIQHDSAVCAGRHGAAGGGTGGRKRCAARSRPEDQQGSGSPMHVQGRTPGRSML